MYADDSTLHVSGKSSFDIENKLQNELTHITNWCSLNNMALNPCKTTYMLIGSTYKTSKSHPLNLSVQDIPIKKVTNQKLLGIYIDQNLKWNVQVDKLCEKLSSKFTLLRRISKYLTLELKQMFYNAYILPVFDYGSITWSSCGKQIYSKLLIFQKRIARWILAKPCHTPSAPLFVELKWLSMENRHKFHIAVMTYKVLNNDAPSYLNHFISISESNRYNLRSTSKRYLNHTRANTEYLKQSFRIVSMQVWNDIPYHIRNSVSLKTFKYQYKSYLLNESTT